MAYLTTSENMLNEIFSFLPGYTIIHKIALINKRIRNALTKLEPFGQGRIISLKIGISNFMFQKKPIFEKGLFGENE